MNTKELDGYLKFLSEKQTAVQESGFDVEDSDLNPLLFPFQKYCVKRALKVGRFAMFEDCGLGKEQPYSEPVLTPTGFVEMGSLKVGDYVISANGNKTKITNIYEQGVKDVYKVSFSDGTYTRCGLNHLWNVRTLNDCSRNNDYRAMELKDIMADYIGVRDDDKRYPNKPRNVYKYSIPVNGKVSWDVDENITIHPYLLGVILGDGGISQRSVIISKPNKVIHDKLRTLDLHGDIVTDFHKDGLSYNIRNKENTKASWTKKELEKLNLMGCKSIDKFIPSNYLYASIESREELLQGLIDTDGHLVKGGNVIEYSTASERLMNDVSFLARSLGYMVRVKKRTSYYDKNGERFPNFRVYLYKNCRKLKNIVNIEKVGQEKQRCIYVEDSSHLYLTRDFIVTHNTVQQLEWAQQVVNHINKPVLILAPLGVIGQTIKEGVHFGYKVTEIAITTFDQDLDAGIYITNYDNMDNIDAYIFGGVVLDESSILKNFAGKTRTALIEDFKNTPYKLCCTATPSPNDTTELCNHAEFLNIMTRNEMLAMYFVHDGGSTSDWRLKGHAQQDFWDFVSTWAVMLSKPSDIGFSDDGYILPPMNVIEDYIVTEKKDNGALFNDMAVSATDFHKELRRTIKQRLERVAEIVNASSENWIIWIGQDEEGKVLRELIPDAVEVKGSDSKQYKKDKLLGFANNEFRVLVTKLKIASFGLNYQNCRNQMFASLDFSFEATYQGIRRSYRFGQKDEVNIHIITLDTMQNVKSSFEEKQKKFIEMQKSMTEAMCRNINNQIKLKKMEVDNNYQSKNCDIRLGDCVQLIQNVPDESIGFSIFSPPFAELYTYSDKLEDMGNSKDYKEFFTAFKYLVKELYRVLWSGRNVAVHCMDLPIQKGKEGYIGLRDFSGMILEAFQEVGFIYHSRVTIWKNPVTEMQRTKALGLLHKQVKKDAAMSRVGIPDYLMVFRKEGEHEHPVHCDISVDTWQKYASPVWMDIDYSKTLNGIKGRDENDEKHICLAKGSLVLTKRGYIPIENVVVGDETLTHTGKWRKVLVTKKTGINKECVKVKAKGVPNLICTPNHKIYSRDRVLKGKKHTLVSEIQWNEASTLSGKYVNQKLPPVVDSPISNQEWWIIGRWCADGHVDCRGHQFFVSIGNNKLDDFLDKADGYIGAMYSKEGCTQIVLKNLSDDAREMIKKIGFGAANKVLPYEAISLDKEKSRSLLDGYLSGDGCNCRGRILFSSISRALLLGLNIVVQRVYGKTMAIYAGRGERTSVIEGREVHCHQEWVGSLGLKHQFGKVDDEGYWQPVKEVEYGYTSDVYNITVDEDHSYTAEGCIVKNCPLQLDTIERAITLWSNKGDKVLTPFLGIGSEVYQSIKMGRFGVGFELKDSYFNEAVKNCKAAEADTNAPTLFDM